MSFLPDPSLQQCRDPAELSGPDHRSLQRPCDARAARAEGVLLCLPSIRHLERADRREVQLLHAGNQREDPEPESSSFEPFVER
eukprot:COSAG04_NODE_10996_length_738_cov_1.084507_2_plen_83_part_01